MTLEHTFGDTTEDDPNILTVESTIEAKVLPMMKVGYSIQTPLTS
jgi:hypothetical protein